MTVSRAHIGLGSNLENPSRQVERALRELCTLAATSVLARSSLYHSEPLGPPGQPDYINAAAALDTELSPERLLAELQRIERAHGRVRDVRWGPRTLDLDLLLYDDLRRDDARLTLPHPRMHERRFVLLPLAEIAPDLRIPGLGEVRELLANCPPLAVSRLS